MAEIRDYLLDVSQRANQELTQAILNGETVKTHLRRGFNFYHQDFNKRFPWPWLEKLHILTTIANVDGGTVTVTQDSRTVTGLGTAFTDAMKGRYLKLNREDEIYEILSVTNGTTLTLRTPYIKSSGSVQTYIIWNKYYSLPPDVRYLSDIHVSLWPHETAEIPRKNLEKDFIQPYLSNQRVEAWAWGGIDRAVSTYSTGTVTVIKDSKTLTGSGTSWLDNVYSGSKITIDADIYNIESIDSDTQITMAQKANVAVSGSAYEIETKNRSKIIFSSVPDPRVNLMITYPKVTYDLTNDKDEVEVWNGFQHILTNVLHGYLLEKLTSDDAFKWLDIYEGQVNEAWTNLQERSSMEAIPHVSSRVVNNYRRTLYG